MMVVRPVNDQEREAFDAAANHPMQSWAWGEFRQATGHRVLRLGLFQDNQLRQSITATVHPVPGRIPGLAGRSILYCPRAPIPNHMILAGLQEQAAGHGGIMVKLEPDCAMPVDQEFDLKDPAIAEFLQDARVRPGRPLFTPYNFWLDLTPPDEQLMKNMKSKTRYNVRLARRKGVVVQEDNSDQAFERYLELMVETTERQGFFAHDLDYHRKMWRHLHPAGIAHLLVARYADEMITTWVLFKWKDRLFYPYGASSRRHKNVMANNLVMWTAIQFGKKHGCTIFDLWGTAGRDPDPQDSWYGFHRFKQGFGPQMVQYIGTYDLVVDRVRYPLITQLDNLRQAYLGLRARLKRLPN